jgi:RND superfamily putative drug exporter
VNRRLEGLGRFSARWCWAVILAWVIILGGLLAANRQWGGTYANNYNVPGTTSDDGLNRLNATFPAQGGYSGQIVFHAKTGTLTGDSAEINQATDNVAKLPNVIKAVSPFSSPSTRPGRRPWATFYLPWLFLRTICPFYAVTANEKSVEGWGMSAL